MALETKTRSFLYRHQSVVFISGNFVAARTSDRSDGGVSKLAFDVVVTAQAEIDAFRILWLNRDWVNMEVTLRMSYGGKHAPGKD